MTLEQTLFVAVVTGLASAILSGLITLKVARDNRREAADQHVQQVSREDQLRFADRKAGLYASFQREAEAHKQAFMSQREAVRARMRGEQVDSIPELGTTEPCRELAQEISLLSPAVGYHALAAYYSLEFMDEYAYRADQPADPIDSDQIVNKWLEAYLVALDSFKEASRTDLLLPGAATED